MPRDGSLRDTLRLGLLWHSVNSDNLGIGALTASHLAILRGVAGRLGMDCRFSVIGWRDPGAPYIAGEDVAAVGLRMRDVIRPAGGALAAAIADCDAVLDIGAGDSFADIYGPRRYLMQVASKARVLAAGKPLVLAPQTFGPFERGWAKVAARAIIARAAVVCSRDALSATYLRQLGLRRPVIEATDVALRLPYERPVRVAGGPVRVGINVSGLLFNGGYDRADMFGLATDYAALMRRVVAGFAARSGVETVLVGHVLSAAQPVEDDLAAARAIAAETPGVTVAPRFATPSEAKSFIAGLDFFCGARMHACVAALSSGVAMAPMAYSRKFAGLFGALGYDLAIDLRTDDADAVLAKLDAAFESRERLRGNIAEALAEGERRLALYDEALERVFAAVAARR